MLSEQQANWGAKTGESRYLAIMHKAEEKRRWPSLLPFITGYFFGRFGRELTV
jgi:hypothetical protein